MPDDISKTGEPTSGESDSEVAADLNYREAQMALEVCLAELQSPELDVEQMAGLYQRAMGYAQRCEDLLERVEQDVMQWNPEQPEQPFTPYGT